MDPLQVRLFGYGVPYRADIVDGQIEPLDTDPQQEATDLAAALGLLVGLADTPIDPKGSWAVSVPFGRCGLEGVPREHLVVYHCEAAYIDVLSREGCRQQGLKAGEMVAIEPGTVVRLRARPQMGRRVLVAFQTQDRTPLMGHAAPFTLDGQVPDNYRERLAKGHGAFGQMQRWWETDQQAYQRQLDDFFGGMAARLAGDKAISQTVEAARQAGSYSVADEGALFVRQQQMLEPGVLQRIGQQDEALFRFPGMFGGITTLFNLVK